MIILADPAGPARRQGNPRYGLTKGAFGRWIQRQHHAFFPQPGHDLFVRARKEQAVIERIRAFQNVEPGNHALRSSCTADGPVIALPGLSLLFNQGGDAVGVGRAFHQFPVHIRYLPDRLPDDQLPGQFQSCQVAVDTVEAAIRIPATKPILEGRRG